MPTKFKPTAKILVDRQAKKYRTQNFYLRSTPTEEIQAAINSTNVRPKDKQKWSNELVRRGVL
jgi:hypothetical protein